MRISDANVQIANELRKQIQDMTELIDDGEGIAMLLLWTFLSDHAACNEVDVSTLAREQLECFIEYANEKLKMVREH